MKKLFVFFFLTAISASLILPQEFDIRKLKWGMSFEDVQNIEGLKSDFYKEEETLGVKVEVLFGCDLKGLYAVSYSTQDKSFAAQVRAVLKKKYGEPKTDLDYSFLIKSKDLLTKYPDTVIDVYEKGDFTKLDANTEIPLSDKKLLRIGLSKRALWEYGNTVALLLNTVEGVVLGYWSKPYHNESKKKFIEFLPELKKLASEVTVKKKTEEGEKF
jgi:hypothetical protein